MSQDCSTNKRELLPQAKRIIVKLGTRVLVNESGKPNLGRIRSLVKQIANLRREGREVVIVTSGAIGAGMKALKQKTRPRSLPELQMTAAVGQSRLMMLYDSLFSKHNCQIGQILLTHQDLRDRKRHLNARNTMMTLLRSRVIPIVNENDAIAVDEIKFGDNDALAALTAILVDAEVLVLLTNVDGLEDLTLSRGNRRLSHIESVDDSVLSLVKDVSNSLSTGGMRSKLEAAKLANEVGCLVMIANGTKPGILNKVFQGKDVGTLVGGFARLNGKPPRLIHARKRWIAFFHRVEGYIVVDPGAENALLNKRKSLLPIGVREVQGQFAVGSPVGVKSIDGRLIAKGLVSYSSEDTEKIMGKRTSALKSLVGERYFEEVIHRDNLIVIS